VGGTFGNCWNTVGAF